MYHFIYKIVCTVTGKYYIGRHSTDDLNDGYLGSGVSLAKSKKKYGDTVHSLEILEFHQNLETLKIREAEIVNEDLLLDPNCMNLCLGGGDGWEAINKMPRSEHHRLSISKGLKGKRKSELAIKHYTESRVQNGNTKRSPECKKKISEALTGKIQSEETRKKRSNSILKRGAPGKKYQIVENPNGDKFIVKNSLKTFCQEHGLYVNSLLNTYKYDLPNKRNPGWKIVKTGLIEELNQTSAID